MRMGDIRVGMRLRSTTMGGVGQEFVTVVGITEKGFAYKLDVPVLLHPFLGTMDGGEHYGLNGEAFYETADRSLPTPDQIADLAVLGSSPPAPFNDRYGPKPRPSAAISILQEKS